MFGAHLCFVYMMDVLGPILFSIILTYMYIGSVHAMQCTGITARMYSCVGCCYIVLVVYLTLLYQDTLAAPLDSDDGVNLYQVGPYPCILPRV